MVVGGLQVGRTAVFGKLHAAHDAHASDQAFDCFEINAADVGGVVRGAQPAVGELNLRFDEHVVSEIEAVAGFDTDDGAGHHVVALFETGSVGDRVLIVDAADLGHQVDKAAVVTVVGAVQTHSVDVVVGGTGIEVGVADRVVKAHANEEVAAHGSVKAHFDRAVVVFEAATVKSTVVVASPSAGSLRHGAQRAHTIGKVGELGAPHQTVHQGEIGGGGNQTARAGVGARDFVTFLFVNRSTAPQTVGRSDAFRRCVVAQADAVKERFGLDRAACQFIADRTGVVELDSSFFANCVHIKKRLLFGTDRIEFKCRRTDAFCCNESDFERLGLIGRANGQVAVVHSDATHIAAFACSVI